MTYFTKQFSAEIVLPDGTVAASAKDIDRYLKAEGLASRSDYSAEYFAARQRDNEKTQRREIFAEIVQQYKKRIWNE